MRFLVLAGLLFATTTAHADAPHTCKPTGKSVLEVKHKNGARLFSTTTVYANGAWVYDQPGDPVQPGEIGEKPGKDHTAGCLDAKALATFKANLDTIDWTVQHAKIHCMAISSNTTEYSTGGIARFTQRLCGDNLAEASMTKLTAILGVLKTATLH